MKKLTCFYAAAAFLIIGTSSYAQSLNKMRGGLINNAAGKIQAGATITLGGNQETGIKVFASCTGLVYYKAAGAEGGLRIGANLYQKYKSARYISEIDATWFLGAVIGRAEKTNNILLPQDEFKFAGSGIPANIKGFAWGIGGVGLLTGRYKNVNISNYLGTQYIKVSVSNVSLTLNHTNDAMMGKFWLKKGLPPIYGFFNSDWHRTTELSGTLNIAHPDNAVAIYGRISLFTPKVLVDPVSGKRGEIFTGNVHNGKPQRIYILDRASHGTFFSFCQVGVMGSWGLNTVSLNYSCGNPQPQVQNHFAHSDGYEYPLFCPELFNMSPNQSKHSIGGTYTISNLAK